MPAPVADIDVVMFSSCDDEPGPPSPLSPTPAPGTPITIDAPEGDAGVTADLVVDGVGDDAVAIPVAGDWPDRLEGMPLRKIAGRVGVHGYFGRLGLACPCTGPEHEGCSRTRSTQLLVAELGREAPLVYLGCWAFNFHQPDHKRWKPTLAEMREYKATRLDTGLATA